MAVIIDGEQLALSLEFQLKQQVEVLKIKGIRPKLAVLVMADDAAGQLYCRLKQAAAQRVGIELEKHEFSFQELKLIMQKISDLNRDHQVQGIMIQHPGINWGKKHRLNRRSFEMWWRQLAEVIAADKDVDGLRENSKFIPATVRAVKLILSIYKSVGDRKTDYIVVVGSQGMIGRQLVRRLKAFGVDVETKELAKITKKADILISCTGKQNLIKADMVKVGATVIDVGWPKGDVDFDQVKEKARVITPVPGGVGPITVVCLLENLVNCLYTSSTDDD